VIAAFLVLLIGQEAAARGDLKQLAPYAQRMEVVVRQKSAPFADRLLTVREVAAFLRVSTRTVYLLCDEGKLAHVRIANAIRVEPATLAAFVRSRAE